MSRRPRSASSTPSRRRRRPRRPRATCPRRGRGIEAGCVGIDAEPEIRARRGAIALPFLPISCACRDAADRGRDARERPTLASSDSGNGGGLREPSERSNADLPRDRRVVPCDAREDRVERLVDRVREDVCAADHRDAEDDGERGERAAQLARRQPLSANRVIARDLLHVARISCAQRPRHRGRCCPSARNRTRSAKEAARASCVTITTVCPKCRRRGGAAEDLAARLRVEVAVGSSAKTTRAGTGARAIATRCCWPPESSDGRWWRRLPRPTVR